MPIPLSIRGLILLLIAISSTQTLSAPRPATDRIDAVVGQPIVLLLNVDNEQDLREGLRVKLDDARVIDCPVYWIGSDAPEPAPRQWTRPQPTTHARELRSALLNTRDNRTPGAWYTLIAIPLDAVGQGIWIESDRYELNWLPDPERALLEADGRDIRSFFTPSIPDGSVAPQSLLTAAEQFSQSPFTRWRARLILDGLNPAERFRPLDAQRPEGYLEELHSEVSDTTNAEAFLDALAHQYEIRWQIILGRIWLIDPSLADRLKRTLTRVVRFDQQHLPLWPSNRLTLDELAHDLLSPWVNDKLRATRAQAWLDTLPRAVTWIVDDLGELRPETGRFAPSVSIVSLPPERGDTLVRLDAPGAQSTLSTIDDESMHTLAISIPRTQVPVAQTIMPTHQLTVRLGRASFTRPAVSAPFNARPPGIRVGPLLRDWTMNELMATQPIDDAPTPVARSTAGVLHRTTTPDEPDPRVGWTLFIECASQTPSDAEDSLTVWIGPFTHPLAVWSINADGEVLHLRGSISEPETPSVRVLVLDDRWTAQIELPPQSILEDMLLAIGVERSDADGYHSAWPRRMIPGQIEPARLFIDVSTWDGFRQTP